MAIKRGGAAVAEKEELPQVSIDTALQGRIITAKKEANQFLIERRDELDICFTGLIAGRHVMLVGPPGTAKSRLAWILCRLINGNIFDMQFNKYSMPEEVFGPLDIPSLTGANTGKSQFVRVTTNMLPEAHIAHFDELGKGSTAIINTLLRVLNEGEFINNGVVVKVPLLFAISSANEWIGEESKETGALFDRFTLRKTIKQISGPAGQERLLFDDTLDQVKFSVKLTPADILKARAEAMQIPFTKRTKDVLKAILSDLQANGIVVGDRRARWSVSVAKAAAYLAGSTQVDPEHLEILSHVLWAEPIEQPVKATAIIMKRANPQAAQIAKLLGEAEEIVASTPTNDLPVVIAATKKLEDIGEKLDALKQSERRDAAIEFVEGHYKELKMKAIGGFK